MRAKGWASFNGSRKIWNVLNFTQKKSDAVYIILVTRIRRNKIYTVLNNIHMDNFIIHRYLFYFQNWKTCSFKYFGDVFMCDSDKTVSQYILWMWNHFGKFSFQLFAIDISTAMNIIFE